jgi:hypothetical protein
VADPEASAVVDRQQLIDFLRNHDGQMTGRALLHATRRFGLTKQAVVERFEALVAARMAKWVEPGHEVALIGPGDAAGATHPGAATSTIPNMVGPDADPGATPTEIASEADHAN